MFQILYPLVHFIQPFLVPICFVFAWLFMILTVWSLFSIVFEGVDRVRQMHQIPCANCQYFTGDYALKCTVHPSIALSEDAICCPDYHPTSNLY
ncbi:MAG: hypothetical protein LH660_02530 [Phormidesmis sp. CAN_BIN36]|nr:hypothetical protein [Phormidesmis sp. CAN_BIN36]